MLIEAHIIAFNESDIIRLTIQHYKKFCENVVIWDNYSTDGTADISHSLGCEVRQFGKRGELNDFHYLQVKNEEWKKSRSDFIVTCDCDEILYHPNLLEEVRLAKVMDYTVFETEGYAMFADQLPKNDWLEVNEGIPDGSYSKTLLFSKKVRDICFQPGAHVSAPRKKVVSPTTLKVLHMRNAGGIERVIQRHEMYRARLSKVNIQRDLGIHYGRNHKETIFTDEYKRAEWIEKNSHKRPVI